MASVKNTRFLFYGYEVFQNRQQSVNNNRNTITNLLLVVLSNEMYIFIRMTAFNMVAK